jgi:hypothetical protein
MVAPAGLPSAASAQDAAELDELIGALLGDTPMVDDLRELTDSIGGRVTGTAANEAAVDWALEKFEDAGVSARAESFEMPRLWVERETRVFVSGDIEFSPRAVAKHYSALAGADAAPRPLLFLGRGSEADFAAAGSDVEGSWVLIETDVVADIDGLFGEYAQSALVEPAAAEAGAAGVAYISSRPMGLLYSLGAMLSADNELPIVVIEREEGLRLKRQLERGATLELAAVIDASDGSAFQSRNVIAEIPGTDLADEIIVFGAHLDSYGLGTGANDNGCNVSMLIDIARQMSRLGVRPRRTVRFALWNGEEQGFNGSWRYTEAHQEEMEDHVVAASIDIGSGRITGFWTNGRGGELLAPLDRALEPVSGLGPFEHSDDAIFGTDNFDFLINGVANLVAIHESANYGPNYHAESDTFDKVNQSQLRLNAAIIAAVIYGLANDEALDPPRHSRAQIEELVSSTPLEAEMRDWNVYDAWASGERGRR